jgi:hypothetical protein
MKNKFLFVATLLSIVFFVGCTTEVSDENLAAKTITADEMVVAAEIDASIDDIAMIAEDQFELPKSKAAKISAPIKSILPSCATVTSVLTNETWKRTIDFGTQGCTMPNGNVLKGKIIISFSRDFTTKTRTVNYTLENFYHNDKFIESSKNITYELKTSDLLATIHPVATHLIDAKVSYPNGKIYTRTGTRVREMVEGFLTIENWEDNVFKIYGNHATTFPNGNSVSSTTLKTEAHVVKMSCKMPFPVAGITEMVKNGIKSTLNFGNGDCDKMATITINGVSKEIVLKK